MMSAPQTAQEGNCLPANVREIDLDAAADLVEQGIAGDTLDFGSSKLVVLESAICGRYAVLTTASGRCAQLLLR